MMTCGTQQMNCNMELIEKALNLVREAQPNEEERQSMQLFNNFMDMVIEMDKEFKEFESKNPNHKLIASRKSRLKLMTDAGATFMRVHFSMQAYKERAIEAQADMLSVHSKYEEALNKLKEYELSNKLETDGIDSIY